MQIPEEEAHPLTRTLGIHQINYQQLPGLARVVLHYLLHSLLEDDFVHLVLCYLQRVVLHYQLPNPLEDDLARQVSRRQLDCHSLHYHTNKHMEHPHINTVNLTQLA